MGSLPVGMKISLLLNGHTRCMRKQEPLPLPGKGQESRALCHFSEISSLEIRGITDTADHEAPAAFETSLRLAMENLGKFLVRAILE
jgi:hypothetical protein